MGLLGPKARAQPAGCSGKCCFRMASPVILGKVAFENVMALSRNSWHETLRPDEPPAGSSDRSFGLVFAGFFGFLAILALWRGHGPWPRLVGSLCSVRRFGTADAGFTGSAQSALDEAGAFAVPDRQSSCYDSFVLWGGDAGRRHS